MAGNVTVSVQFLVDHLGDCMKRFVITAVGVLSASTAMADITKITCSFRYDGFEGGKSNIVSCAMSPEEVLSTNRRPKASTDMCDQKSNAFQENYDNYVVDLAAKSISYTGVLQISDFAKPAMIRDGMENGVSREKATTDANKVTKRNWSHQIDSVNVGIREVYFKMTGGMYDPPKQIPNYIVRYGEFTLHYSVGVPEAVIVEATGDERHTWVAMRFGLCQSE
jgi:hypothetical protein